MKSRALSSVAMLMFVGIAPWLTLASDMRNWILFNALDADRSQELEIKEVNAGILIGAFPDRFSLTIPPSEKDVKTLANDPQVAARAQSFFHRHGRKPSYTKEEID